MRLPVYSDGAQPTTLEQRRAREIGALAVSLRLTPLIEGALKGEVLDTFRVRIRDIGFGSDVPFFDSATATQPDAPGYVHPLEFGERRWEISLLPRPAAHDGRRLQVVIASGSTISRLPP